MDNNPKLGDLELEVLEHVWQHGEVEIKSAHQDLGEPRGITHNTVQSAFKRLWEKKLLQRRKVGHAHLYSSKISRQELTERLVGELIEQVAGPSPSVALEAFVNLAERAGEDTLAELEELVSRRRQDRGKS